MIHSGLNLEFEYHTLLAAAKVIEGSWCECCQELQHLGYVRSVSKGSDDC